MSKPEYGSRPVTVEKPIPVTYDLGNLSVFDTNQLDKDTLDSSNAQREKYLSDISRDNAQLLINQLLSLPVQTTTDSTNSSIALLHLPEPSTELPREKPLPKAKEMTKWEKFAKLKGIQSKEKAGKLIFDEPSGKWVPKWGYKGANKKLDDQWIVEVDDKVKGTKDELVDPRSLNRIERKRLVKKNEKQQKMNLKGSEKK